MAERKPWASLSPNYRERLARKGITPQMHAAGESIRAARGHEHTPEHPSEAGKRPGDFIDYVSERRTLQVRVAQMKRQMFGDEHKFNPRRSREIVGKGWDGNHAPSNTLLRWALDASFDEIMDAITSGDEDYSFLWYH